MTAAEMDRVPYLDLLPEYDVESQHTVEVRASVERVYACARQLDLSRSWKIRTLFRLRGLPASALNLDGLTRIRFKPLREDPPRGYVLGLIGQFWSPSGRLLDFDPAEFTTLSPSGFARALWTFDVRPGSDGVTHLRTTTRVHCADDDARRRFLLYWKAVGPFSGLIRKEALREIRREAEAGG